MIKFTTGEFRATLQPVRFVRLDSDVSDPNTGVTFGPDTIVSVQYWGAGKVVVTRFPDGATVTPVAHNVQGGWADWGDVRGVDGAMLRAGGGGPA